MSVLLKKGEGYNAEFASTDYPVLSADWTGSLSLYTTYPGIATFTKALVRVGDIFTLELTPAEILALSNGVYYFVPSFSNAVLGITLTSVDYATVTETIVTDVPRTKLYATITKSDGSPAGKEVRSVTGTVSGATVVLSWQGIAVSVSNTVADDVSGMVAGTEPLTVYTNAVGYVEVYVIKGLTVNVSCPAFGKTVTVDTTGLDQINLSSYFDAL